MCGIVGGFGKVEWPVAEMIHAIAHRGPDHHASFVEGDVFFGHTRLSIQDLSESGNQPMVSDNGRYVIIFNGEIYNHFDLRKELKPRSYRSTSDTETILAAYQEWGVDFLPKLNGIFAFALYDRQDQSLLLARDRFGVKPLYVSEDNNRLIFSSEIKALLPVLKDHSLDVKALHNYLTFLWSPGQATAFIKVKKLNPGSYSYFSFSDGQLQHKNHKFYQIPFTGQYSKSSEQELIDVCEEKLLQAVERQLLSDVPVGFFLSGGLDSSLVVAMAKKLHPNQRWNCFTIDTGDNLTTEGFSSDIVYAEKVAKALDVNLHVVKAEIDIVRDFDYMIWHLDEPQADAAPLNVSNICKKAREMGFKVLLGGTAGDDVFSGYRRHQALQLEKYLRWIPNFLSKVGLSLPLNQQNPVFRRIKKILLESSHSKEVRLANYYRWLPQEVVSALFNESHQQELNDYQPTKYFFDKLKDIPNETSWLNKMLYWEMTSFLPDHNLNYTDKMGMAHGVEIRVPYLDNELVEFACSLPPVLKLKGNETKYILKKVAERYLPKDVIYRSKTGFGAPVRKWITEDLEDVLNERLSRKQIAKAGIFDADKVWKLIEDNKAGVIDASYSIWCLLAIDSWINQFVMQEESLHEAVQSKP